jgi:hypothetical protein
MLLAQTTTFLPPELLPSPSVAMSPAARLATIERSVHRPMATLAPDYDMSNALAGYSSGGGDGTLAAMLGPACHPSILSPLPSSLPSAAASGLFSLAAALRRQQHQLAQRSGTKAKQLMSLPRAWRPSPSSSSSGGADARLAFIAAAASVAGARG